MVDEVLPVLLEDLAWNRMCQIAPTVRLAYCKLLLSCYLAMSAYLSAARVEKMKRNDLESMSVDELWSLRAQLISVLTGKISAEKVKIDRRLRQLDLGAAPNNSKKIAHARRPYPQVFPKYSNPAKPSETWAGRGKQPLWLTAQLRSGKRLDDFRIQPPSKRGAALRKVEILTKKKSSRR